MDATPTTAYTQLEDRFRRLGALGEAAAVLRWDWAAMMPDGGVEARTGQLAELKAVRFGLLTAPEVGDLIAEAQTDDGLDAWQRANVHEMHRRWLRATSLSEELVVAMTRAHTACETVWRKARPEGDFAAVLPTFETVIELEREAATRQGEVLGLGPYDALLDLYEAGLRTTEIEAVFADLEAFLPGFLAEVIEHQKTQPAVIAPEGPFATDDQRALGQRMMEALGFDFDHGRLDVSHHPFCGGTPDDVRITTRYDEDDFTKSLMAVLHETGHALYNRGLPVAWRNQPVGGSLGTVIHESQSLLVEMQVCRSTAFMAFAAPAMADAFGGSGPAWEADNLHRLYGRVEPSFIRVDADEVTYPLHVILRYRLETAMLADDLAAADLPVAWNEGMNRLLGITPPSDSEGCLQDVHWYDGAWGYFPTYTLGAMAAAQIFEAATRADDGINDGIGRGDFKPLMTWLGEHVHSKGSLLSADDLMVEVTGRPLAPDTFKAHLRSRYLA